MLNPYIQERLSLVNALFKSHNVKCAYAFGSSVGYEFNEESDIDFLISFEEGLEPLEKGKIWWELHDGLRQVLKREIDLLIESSLNNPYFIEEINEKKQLIYAA
jgi:predicted nucleotidyltransferase